MGDKAKYYKNPNGEFTEEDFAQIKREGKVDEFQRNFKLIDQPCPPKKLRGAGAGCMHCWECFDFAFNKVKIRKGK